MDLQEIQNKRNAPFSRSLVSSTQEGYLVKKDGITGWYKGRVEGACKR